jgi:hypothetical protein
VAKTSHKVGGEVSDRGADLSVSLLSRCGRDRKKKCHLLDPSPIWFHSPDVLVEDVVCCPEHRLIRGGASVRVVGGDLLGCLLSLFMKILG